MALRTGYNHDEYFSRLRIFDAAQRAAAPSELESYRHLVFDNAEMKALEDGEWAAWMEADVPAASPHEFWADQAQRAAMPMLARAALRHLRRPITACDVERSFSLWKIAKSVYQERMGATVHSGRVSFLFNGDVPKPP